MARKYSDQYFVRPAWGHLTSFGSGTSMEVTLGPDAILSVNRGSTTGATSIPRCMEPLNKKDFTRNIVRKTTGLWVAGHLLNENLGGDGTQGSNLTPLTQTANKNHATYEGYIKDALTVAERLKRHDRKRPVIFGIKYTVDVHQTFGNKNPYNKAPSHITIAAEIWTADRESDRLSIATAKDYADLSKSDEQNLQRASFAAVEIHNRDEHLTSCANEDCDHDVDMG